MDRKPIISFRNFSFQYNAQKQPTLKNINLDIYPGEKIMVCGASGSGKSTLGNCINGLIPFSFNGKIEGSLIVDGIETKNSSIFELSTRVGTVLQDPDRQFVGLTVAEDIAFALENDCVEQAELIKQTFLAAQTVNIQDHLEKAPFDLSGGQKQRVSMAGVLVDKVKILLFDEPLANLDPATGKSAIELIEKIKNDTDTTVLIIEHRIEDVMWERVDRIILMDEGVIIADMKPQDMLKSSLLRDYGIRRNDNDYILEVENLNFAYEGGHQVLFDVSFRIKKGEMLAIVGTNGAGKSTLCKLICNFEKATEGKIIFDHEDITEKTIRARAKHIGYVMQNPNQMISQTMIYDEVAMGLAHSGLSEDEIKEKVYDILKVCGLYEFRNWPISALSFGQKKRVTIASILVMGPQIIILDEPTAGQDYRHYTEIMEFLKSMNARGITVIMITHDMHLMLEYTDRALVFSRGHLIADESSSAVLCDPELVREASLKETSLFNIAEMCGIDDPVEFVDCFIECEKKGRESDE